MGLAPDLEDYHPSVLLHCWLGHLTCKIVSEMTYNVSSGTVNPTILLLVVFIAVVGLPVFNHVLIPRSKGFWMCTERLRARTNAIYDVTIAYSSTRKPTSDQNSTFRAAAPTLRGIWTCRCQSCVDVSHLCNEILFVWVLSCMLLFAA